MAQPPGGRHFTITTVPDLKDWGPSDVFSPDDTDAVRGPFSSREEARASCERLAASRNLGPLDWRREGEDDVATAGSYTFSVEPLD